MGIAEDVDGFNYRLDELSVELTADHRLHEDGLHSTFASVDRSEIQHISERILRRFRDELLD